MCTGFREERMNMDVIRASINGVAKKVEATDRGIVRLSVLLECFRRSESGRAARIRDLLSPFTSESSSSTGRTSATGAKQEQTQDERDEEAFGSWLLGIDLLEPEEDAVFNILGEDEESSIDSLDAVHPDTRFRLYLTWVHTHEYSRLRVRTVHCILVNTLFSCVVYTCTVYTCRNEYNVVYSTI